MLFCADPFSTHAVNAAFAGVRDAPIDIPTTRESVMSAETPREIDFLIEVARVRVIFIAIFRWSGRAP
jgi:hypothetical protein